MKWKRVAPGEYQTADGRYIMWRVPDVYPPAWNVEENRPATDDEPATFEVIVDGAATKRDAAAIFDEEVKA